MILFEKSSGVFFIYNDKTKDYSKIIKNNINKIYIFSKYSTISIIKNYDKHYATNYSKHKVGK